MFQKNNQVSHDFDLTKYENYVGCGVELLDLRTDANADTLPPCTIAVFHRIVSPFAMASAFAYTATHAIQCVPRLACLCALARRHLRSEDVEELPTLTSRPAVV